MFSFLNPTAAKSAVADQLATELHQQNQQYRKGEESIPDSLYDQKVESLRAIEPDHPYLHIVEGEALSGNTVKHDVPMLSTQKAYESGEVKTWLSKVRKAAYEAGIQPSIKAMAKLDGVACKKFADGTLATRGSGLVGNVVTHLLDAGLKIIGNPNGEVVGEIVMPQSYFDQNLKDLYKLPRSFVSGVVNADSLSDHAIESLANGGIHLVLFKDMPSITVGINEFEQNHSDIEEQLRANCEYPIDGVVFEVVEPEIQEVMGSSSHHNHYQLAKKQMATLERTTVLDVVWTVGRSGVIFPTVLIQPVLLSGTTVSRASGKHAGYIRDNKVGRDAVLHCNKSGEIIPDIKAVLEPSDYVVVPTHCPCCNTLAVMVEDQLFCENPLCTERLESTIIHHFSTIRALYFGRKTVQKLVANGYDTIIKVYGMTLADYMACGLGEGEANKLLTSIDKAKTEELGDNFLVASLGISDFGRGSASKVLAHYSIGELLSVTQDQLLAIEGFGDKTSVSISTALKDNETLAFLLEQGFNLVHTKEENERKAEIAAQSSSPLAGKRVVFTGTCTLSRDGMNSFAESLGCIAQKSVNNQTDYLVCGTGVGSVKMAAAQKKGAKVITEEEFRQLA